MNSPLTLDERAEVNKHCMVCATALAPDDIIWSLPNGWLSTTFGEPYCFAHVPNEKSISIDQLGAFVKGVRERLGINQFQFARLVKVSPPTLLKFEAGNLNIRYQTVRSILANMGLDAVGIYAQIHE